MAKAMLIMDKPTSCMKCILSVASRENHTGQICFKCIKHPTKIITQHEARNEKPTWCPLREVPSKHEDGHTLKVAIENDCYDDTVQDDAWCEGVDKGYNACIDEILGGGE